VHFTAIQAAGVRHSGEGFGIIVSYSEEEWGSEWERFSLAKRERFHPVPRSGFFCAAMAAAITLVHN
jgi:hypothetical protein